MWYICGYIDICDMLYMPGQVQHDNMKHAHSMERQHLVSTHIFISSNVRIHNIHIIAISVMYPSHKLYMP